MSWVAVAVGSGLVGAGSKYLEAKQQQKQEQAAMEANAAAIQYSPWTGAKVGIMAGHAGSPTAAGLGGALQGGMSGIMMGAANGGFGSHTAAASAAGAQTAPMNNMNISDNTQGPMGSKFKTLYGSMA